MMPFSHFGFYVLSLILTYTIPFCSWDIRMRLPLRATSPHFPARGIPTLHIRHCQGYSSIPPHNKRPINCFHSSTLCLIWLSPDLLLALFPHGPSGTFFMWLREQCNQHWCATRISYSYIDHMFDRVTVPEHSPQSDLVRACVWVV